jgi:hypothetical protein
MRVRVFVRVCVVSVEFLWIKFVITLLLCIFCALRFSLQVTKVGRLSSTSYLYLSIYKIAQNKKFKLHETVRLLT